MHARYTKNNNANKLLSQFVRNTNFLKLSTIEGQGQRSLKLIGILSELRCILILNLKIMTSIGGGLSPGQAQKRVNFEFKPASGKITYNPALLQNGLTST